MWAAGQKRVKEGPLPGRAGMQWGRTKLEHGTHSPHLQVGTPRYRPSMQNVPGASVEPSRDHLAASLGIELSSQETQTQDELGTDLACGLEQDTYMF